MVRLEVIFVVLGAFWVAKMTCMKTFGDMFPHKHKTPVPFPIPEWEPDTNLWDEALYPPITREFTRTRGKVRVRLTSDSPAMNGSLISFTARLEFPKCQKKDWNGNLVHDEDCEDANGQVLSGDVQNWTSWLDDYGFVKCTDLKRCNVFPDGKPFPQHSDWRRRGYVYVWHTLGQYHETCDGTSSSLTLNTTDWTLGAGVMEVMVYHKRERRKYSPLSTDSTVFCVTDEIPLAVNISQKEAANVTERNVFIKGYGIIFKVQIHDPSNYLRTADSVDFIWDFRDGNQLITHSNVAAHAYSLLGNVTVKLVVQAAFRTKCPPPIPTPMPFTQPYTTGIQSTTAKLETTKVITPSLTTAWPVPITTATHTTESFSTDPDVITSVTVTLGPEVNSSIEPSLNSMARHTHFTESECFRYMDGTFEDQIFIIEPPPTLHSLPPNQIVEVSAAMVTNTTVNFVVTCLGSIPISACTTVADSTCHQVLSIVCDDVNPSSEGCRVILKRTFQEPGTYCVNITLSVPGSLALSTTTITIGNTPDKASFPGAAEVVLSSSVVLLAIFGFIGFMVYRRHRLYRPVRRSILEDTEEHKRAGSRLSRLKAVLFSANEERSHLLPDRHL